MCDKAFFGHRSLRFKSFYQSRSFWKGPKDLGFLKQVDKFSWIKEFDKPLHGICAGMQTIGLVFEAPLIVCLQIRINLVSTLKYNPLFQDPFFAYTLRNYSVQITQNFEALAKSLKSVQVIKHKQKKYLWCFISS